MRSRMVWRAYFDIVLLQLCISHCQFDHSYLWENDWMHNCFNWHHSPLYNLCRITLNCHNLIISFSSWLNGLWVHFLHECNIRNITVWVVWNVSIYFPSRRPLNNWLNSKEAIHSKLPSIALALMLPESRVNMRKGHFVEEEHIVDVQKSVSVWNTSLC